MAARQPWRNLKNRIITDSTKVTPLAPIIGQLPSAIPYISQRVVAKTIIENMVVEISVVDRVRQVRTAWGK